MKLSKILCLVFALLMVFALGACGDKEEGGSGSSDANEVTMGDFTAKFVSAELTKGSSDEDGKVNIKDATAIQKHIANLINLTETGKHLADVDSNTTVNIKDATAIQKHIAGMDTGFDIGKEI